MAESAQFGYLQARLQARHGDRPSAQEWRVAEASADLSHYLEAIRRTALKRWINEINQDMTSETIERQLRMCWRETVDQIAAWAPVKWRPAVEWMRWLPDLPAVQDLARGGKLAPWMRDDPVLRDFAFDDPARRREALEHHPLGTLAGAQPMLAPDQTEVGVVWVRTFKSLVPDAGSGAKPDVDHLVRLVEEHLEAMRESRENDGRSLRRLLVETLARRFRRGAGTAVALFSHLALDGLELERIRAGVITRRLMPQREEGRSWA